MKTWKYQLPQYAIFIGIYYTLPMPSHISVNEEAEEGFLRTLGLWP